MAEKFDLNEFLVKAIAGEKPKLLPKQFTPKHDWIEVEKDGYEIPVLKSEVKMWIEFGWRITRLSKLSIPMIVAKHAKSIYAKEQELETTIEGKRSQIG